VSRRRTFSVPWASPARRTVAGLCLIAVTAAGAPLAADDATDEETGDPSIRLEALEEELDQTRQARDELSAESAAIVEELGELREAMLATAAQISEDEAAADELATKLLGLNAELAERRTAFDARRDELAAVLSALQRIARQPAEMLIALPRSPTDTHRTAMLLASITPYLDDQAARIASDIAALNDLKAQISEQTTELQAVRGRLQEQHEVVAGLVARKEAVLAGLEDEQASLAARNEVLAAEANSLRDLLRELAEAAAAERAEGASGDSVAASGAIVAMTFATAQGNLPMPARGEIVTNFNATLDDGSKSEGIWIATADGVQVVTPYDGRIVFSGVFGDYGHLLIIAHGEGYHTVLAGFSRVDAVLGQWLLAGEPVGVMAEGGNGPQRLYVEFRHDGEPINPLPWLAAGDNKVNG
jgi:septal ring factor EnvC (AmiA/AmiB activator)